MATAGWDGHVRVWDMAGRRVVLTLDGHRDEVASLTFSPDGKRLASGSRDHTVLVWAVGDPLPRHALARLGTTRWRQQWSVVSLAYAADGKVLACSSYEEGVALYDAVTGRRLRHLLKGEDGTPVAVALSADGKRVAALHRTTIHLYDTATGTERIRLATPPGTTGVVLAPDGKHLIALRFREGARMLDESGAVVAFERSATTVAFDRDGKTLLVGSDKRVRVWDVATRKEVRRLDGEARLVAASADGRTLAARGKKAIHVWDPTTGAEKRTIVVPDHLLHRESAEMLALSADGRTVALAGHGHLIAWDTATGKERLRHIDGKWYTAVAVAPNGNTLAWGNMYTPVIRRWDLDAGRELLATPGHVNYVKTPRLRAGRQTAGEWQR